MRRDDFTDIRLGQLQGRAYATAGHRPGATFVLLHGIGMSHRYFRKLRAALDAVGTAFALDLPGFGATPKPHHALSVAEYAQFTGRMLDALDINSCVLVGHSMGAQFAVELAAQRPSLVSHLVLIGPVVDSRRRTLLQQGLALARDSIRERPSTNAIVFGDYARCGPRRYLAELGAMLGYPTEDRIGSVQAPVLVMRGARDPIARPPVVPAACESSAEREDDRGAPRSARRARKRTETGLRRHHTVCGAGLDVRDEIA